MSESRVPSGSSSGAYPSAIEMPRSRSSGSRSVSLPVSARTSHVLPWSMCPAVPTVNAMPETLAPEALPAGRQLGESPRRVRPPLGPGLIERPFTAFGLRDHAERLGPQPLRQLTPERARRDERLQLVLVLPAPPPVCVDDQGEGE